MIVKAEGLQKSYAGRVILGPLDLTFRDRETTALLGQSGCGKSTLLRLLLGLIWPDAGCVRIGDQILNASNVREIRRHIGFVTQDGGLFPHLTAMENIMLASRYFHLKSTAERQLDDLLDLTQLDATALQRYPCELSGGQRQRVSLIRALILNPSLVLLDEPMAALDPIIRAEMQTDLKRIFEQLGKTVIMVTHDVAEAAFLSDHIVLMHQGKIVQEGDFATLVHKPSTPFVFDFLNAQRPIVWPASPDGPVGVEP